MDLLIKNSTFTARREFQRFAMYEMFQNNNFLLRLGHEYYPDLEQADVIFISEIAVNCERTLVK